MKTFWSLVILYILIALIFIGLNYNWSFAQYNLNLLFFKGNFYMVPGIIIFSLIFLLIGGIIASAQLERCNKTKENLRAQLYDRSLKEIEELKSLIETLSAEVEENVLNELKEIKTLLQKDENTET